jgi:hypothetical protein
LNPLAPPDDTTKETSTQQPHESVEPQLKGGWTEREIADNREKCMQVLKSVDADLEVLPPVKQGDCGAPVIVRLKRVGSKLSVTFEPPVEVNCEMAAAIYRWNKSSLQPAAQRNLGSAVTSVLGASGYACRNVYNFPDRSLSQHAFANAIDVSAFELRDGRIITVRKGWGPTKRDAKRLTKKTAVPVRANSGTDAVTRDATRRTFRRLNHDTIRRTNLTLNQVPTPESKPRPTKSKIGAQRAKQDGVANFLKRLHNGACEQFDTVLGPEANEVHRGHFHFDLNAIRSRPYCD